MAGPLTVPVLPLPLPNNAPPSPTHFTLSSDMHTAGDGRSTAFLLVLLFFPPPPDHPPFLCIFFSLSFFFSSHSSSASSGGKAWLLRTEPMVGFVTTAEAVARYSPVPFIMIKTLLLGQFSSLVTLVKAVAG